MKMSLKKKVGSTLAVCAIAIGALVAMPTAAQAYGNPAKLDKADFSAQCRVQYNGSGWRAELYGSTAYDWKCVYLDKTAPSERRSLNINSYCMANWGVWAAAPVVSNPYSWKCQGF